MCRKVTWIWLALPYLMFLRASELVAEDDCRVHIVYCLRGEGVAFHADERQVEEEIAHRWTRLRYVSEDGRETKDGKGPCWW